MGGQSDGLALQFGGLSLGYCIILHFQFPTPQSINSRIHGRRSSENDLSVQKMIAALKKVSSDVILNTAKEAAARVLVSERKATRLQYDLKVTKDDSLRMMLLLKQTINSNIIEAENVSSSQRERIEDLEAQLNEAKDTIVDLRAELKNIHGKMDKMNNFNRNGFTQQVHTYERVKGKKSHTFKPHILKGFHRSMRRGKAFTKCRLHPGQQLLRQCPAASEDEVNDQPCSVIETKTLTPLDIFSEPISTGYSGDDSGLVDVVVMEEQGIEDTALVDVAISLENVARSNQKVNYSMSKAEQVMGVKQRDSFKLQKFTFSRKRSRVSTVGNRSVAEIGKKMQKTDKENDPELTTMSGINPQSSRDNRRLVQIARQLVSLSGRS